MWWYLVDGEANVVQSPLLFPLSVSAVAALPVQAIWVRLILLCHRDDNVTLDVVSTWDLDVELWVHGSGICKYANDGKSPRATQRQIAFEEHHSLPIC